MRYRFANLDICWDGCILPLIEDNFAQKFVSDARGQAELCFHEQELPENVLKGAKQLKYAGGYELFETNQGLFQLNHWATCREAFGFWLPDLHKDSTPIYINSQICNEQTMIVSHLLSTIGLHHKLLMHNTVSIHASYIVHQGEAIIFLGPSGIGKSTQAELWQNHADAEIINGDRVLLRKIDGRWTAFGSPCCGSSFICINRSAPLKAIVCLQQAQENQIVVQPAAKQVYALTAATELYPWDPWEIEKAFEIAQELRLSVPVLQLFCTPDQSAVELLKNYLEKTL